jgi:hypothetical protein
MKIGVERDADMCLDPGAAENFMIIGPTHTNISHMADVPYAGC